MDQEYLNKILNKFSNLDINETACSRLISPKSTCDLCENICPVGAISIDSKINVTDTCISCGSCAVACPVGVFKITEPSDKYLLDRATDAGQISIICKKNTEKPLQKSRNNLVQVECLFRFYYEILVTLVIETEEDVYLYCDKNCCNNCQQMNNAQKLLEEIDKANQLLKAIGINNSIYLLDDFPKEINVEYKNINSNCDESKRQLFTETLSGVKKLSVASVLYYFKDDKKIIQNILKDGLNNIKDKNSFKRLILIGTLKKYLNNKKTVNLERKLPINKLQVNNCYLCGVCEKLCPYSAIRQTEGGNMEINYSLCTNCGLCIDVCNTKAIFFSESVMLEEFISENWSKLVESKKYICQTCGTTFNGGNNNNGICLRCKISNDLLEKNR